MSPICVELTDALQRYFVKCNYISKTFTRKIPLRKAFLNIYKYYCRLLRLNNASAIMSFLSGLRHRCSPVNLLHIFRTPFSINTSGWLLLKFQIRLTSYSGRRKRHLQELHLCLLKLVSKGVALLTNFILYFLLFLACFPVIYKTCHTKFFIGQNVRHLKKISFFLRQKNFCMFKKVFISKIWLKSE